MGSHSQLSIVYTSLHKVERHLLLPSSSGSGHHSWGPWFHKDCWATLSELTFSQQSSSHDESKNSFLSAFLIILLSITVPPKDSSILVCLYLTHHCCPSAMLWTRQFPELIPRKARHRSPCSGVPTHWLRRGSLTPGGRGLEAVQKPLLFLFPLPPPQAPLLLLFIAS